MIRRLGSLLIILSIATFASAQPLTDRVPADAVAYLGWAGTETLGDAYAQSHLKNVLDQSDVDQIMTTFIPDIIRKVSKNDPDAMAVADSIRAIGTPMWKHPTAIYFGGIDATDPRNPQPKVALYCDAGADAEALLKDVNAAIARIGPAPVPMNASSNGNIVMVRIGSAPADAEAILATGGEIQAALASVKSDKPVITAYLNVNRLIQNVDRIIEAAPNPDAKQKWPKVRDALGLSGAKYFIWTGQFESRQWATRAFLSAPSPRAGALKYFDGQPISEDALRRVPQSAGVLLAGRCDLAKLLDEIRAVAANIDPEAPALLDRGLGAAKAMLGFDIRNDLLEPLGDEWVMFSTPQIGGNYTFSGVITNRLDDAAKFEKSMLSLQRFASGMINARFRKEGIQINFKQTEANGLTIHYLAVPVLRPSWTIKDGVLYFAFFPQAVASATRPDDSGKSILDNEKFTSLRQRLGDEKAASINYADLPQTAGLMYPTWVLLSGYTGLADLFGINGPAMLFPPMDVLLANLSPAASFSWSDDAGWHMQGVAPFPGARLLTTDASMTVGYSALMTSILLPSLNRARETANRVKCASNMRQMGQACLLYANENRGKYPKDLGEMLATQDISIDVFNCPSGDFEIPNDIKRADVKQQAEWLDENAEYVYLGAGRNNTMGPDEILIYEKLDNHNEDGINILFGDGHVEFVLLDRAVEMIEEAQPKQPGAQPGNALPRDGGL